MVEEESKVLVSGKFATCNGDSNGRKQKAGRNSWKSLLGFSMMFKDTGRASKGGFGVRVVPDG